MITVERKVNVKCSYADNPQAQSHYNAFIAPIAREEKIGRWGLRTYGMEVAAKFTRPERIQQGLAEWLKSAGDWGDSRDELIFELCVMADAPGNLVEILDVIKIAIECVDSGDEIGVGKLYCAARDLSARIEKRWKMATQPAAAVSA